MGDLRQIRDRLAQVRSDAQMSHSLMEDAASSLGPMIEAIKGVFTDIRSHRDMFPLLGDIADTMITYVHLTERLVGQFNQIKGQLYNDGLRPAVPPDEPPLPPVSGQDGGTPGDEMGPNG